MKRILLLMVCVSSVELFAIQRTKPLQANIQDLKGIHQVAEVPSDYAPFWGLTFIEQGIAKLWYMLSSKHLNKEIASQFTGVSELDKAGVLKILATQKNTFTEKLVDQMFHMAGGTFNVTNAPNNPVKYLKQRHIGRVLGMVHEGLKQTDLKLMQEPMEKYLVSLNLLDPSGKPFKAKDFRPFVSALIGAVGECLGDKPLYPKNTAQGLLLGYLLAQSNDRSDLQEYFRGFLNDDTFVLPSDRYTVQDFKMIQSVVPDLQNIESFANYLCSAMYTEKYGSVLPKIMSSKSVAYQGNHFTNCVEAMMSNLVNIATYDSITHKLGHAPEGVTLSPELQKFYGQELHASNADVENMAVHQAWTSLLENRIGCVYNRLVQAGQQGVVEIRNQCDGVIPVDVVDAGLPVKEVSVGGNKYQLFEKRIGSKTYWLIPKSAGLDCFELMPTAANIIVTLNDLLSLNLYASVDETLQSDFVKKYFESMCSKLGWKVEPSILARMIEGTSRISIPVMLKSGERFDIHLHEKAHGYVSVDIKSELENRPSVASVNQSDAAVQAACLGSSLVNYGDIANKHSLGQCVSAINLDSRLRLISEMMPVVGTLVDTPYLAKLIMSMGVVDDTHYGDSIGSFFKARAGEIPTELIDALGIMAQTLYVRGKALRPMFVYTKIVLQRGEQPLIQVPWIRKALQSTHTDIREVVRGIVELSNYQNNTLLFQAMFQYKLLDLQDLNSMMHVDSLQYDVMVGLRDLIENEAVNLSQVDQLMQLVDKGMSSMNKNVQYNATRCIEIMIKKELVGAGQIGQLMQLVGKATSSMNKSAQSSAWRCIEGMIQKGLMDSDQVVQLMQWIDKGMNSSYEHMQYYALVCIKELIKKGLVGLDQVDQLMQMVDKGMNSSYEDVQSKSKRVRADMIALKDGLQREEMAEPVKASVQSTSSMLKFGRNQPKTGQEQMMTEAKRRYSTWSQTQQQLDQVLSQEAQAEQLQWMKRLRNQQLEPQRTQLEQSNQQMSQVHQHEFQPQVPEHPAPKQWSMHRGQTPEQMAIAARAAQRALSRVARSAIR